MEPKRRIVKRVNKPVAPKPTIPKPVKTNAAGESLIRLNKRIADAGICSRREADKLIEAGTVKVNGKVVTAMGTKVSESDVIAFGDQTLKTERKVYILVNKPKDYATTVDDPFSKKTVLQLVARACKERVVPVGKLDRAFTGLLLLTNDSELIKRLSNSKKGVETIYHISIAKPMSHEDLRKLKGGIFVDGVKISPEDAQFVGDGSDKKEIGLTLFSSKTIVVKRLMEELGHKIVKLDRVMMGGLSKKDLPRGKWKFLSKEELAFLKMAPLK